MGNAKVFLGTYWQHARSIFDLIFFVISVVATFFSVQISLPRWAGLLLFCATALIAAYRTWLYQYKETQKLIEAQNKEIEFDDLNDIQKAILRGMSTEADKRIIPTGRWDGADFRGIGNASNDYDNNEIEAEIVELEKIDILRVDSYNNSGRPIYKPTSHGLKILKGLKEHEAK